MKPLVTIGIPIYKRLHFLPDVLRVVNSQDYPNIELIVSDNGVNNSKVPKLIAQYYSRPYKYRQNLSRFRYRNITTNWLTPLRESTSCCS